MSTAKPDEVKVLSEELFLLREQHTILHNAALKMIRAVASNAFIIPNGGGKRDRAIAALDGLQQAAGVANADFGGMADDGDAVVAEEAPKGKARQ